MATTVSDTKSVNRVVPPRIAIVNTLPDLNDVENGAMVLLVSDSHADTLKIHIRTAVGWKKTAAIA